MKDTRKLVYTATFVALGVIIPFFTAHLFSAPAIGSILSPMHIPVFLCGFLCGWHFGIVCGALTPLLSSLITGMPPMWPMLPMMTVELVVYGALSGLLFKKLRLPIWVALPVAIIAGRVSFGVMLILVTGLAPAAMPATLWASVLKGMPGIALQLILIPSIVGVIEVQTKKGKTHKNECLENEQQKEIIIDEEQQK